MTAIREGDRAPVFEARDGEGHTVDFAEIVGHEPFVLFFYPGDFTPGCTAEACSFRDRHDDFADAGVRVFGVSSNDATSHRNFAKEHGLPYPLLVDEDGAIAAAWGVGRTFGLLPGRVTYVVDGKGVVRLVHSSQLSPKGHVTKALELVKSLEGR